MKNVIILGSGRSGTSMVAGILSNSGYYMGDQLLPASNSNPKGFFEDVEINRINEDILDFIVPKRPKPKIIGNLFFKNRPLYDQRWLARVPLDAKILANGKIIRRIQKSVSNAPFCFKDPRFSYTLPIWRPFLENTVYICVFRHPSSTAKSIIKECQDDVALHSLYINKKLALEVWKLMYKHIVEIHSKRGQWLFLHYEQAFTDEGLTKIEKFTESKIDRDFPDKKFNRNISNETLPTEIAVIYRKLCELSDYNSH